MSKLSDMSHKVGHDLLTSNKFAYTFLRSAVSSQTAGWVDMGSSIGLVAIGLSSWLATPVGAVLGGVVNCCINYKFTFRASNCSKIAVAVKYVMIWFGSLVLNTVGTSLLAMVFDRWPVLETLGFTNLGNYAAARLIVSLAVSWFWNFLMQRYFVYRSLPRFDNRIVNLFSRKKNQITNIK